MERINNRTLLLCFVGLLLPLQFADRTVGVGDYRACVIWLHSFFFQYVLSRKEQKVRAELLQSGFSSFSLLLQGGTGTLLASVCQCIPPAPSASPGCLLAHSSAEALRLFRQLRGVLWMPRAARNSGGLCYVHALRVLSLGPPWGC